MRWKGGLLGSVVVGAWLSMGALVTADVQEEGARANGCKEEGKAIEFDLGSKALDNTSKAALDDAAKWASEQEGRSVLLEGYADKSGSPARNQLLSAQRAGAAKAYLAEQGVDPTRVMVTSYGEEATRPELEDKRAVNIVRCEAAATEPEKAAAPPAELPPPVAEEQPEPVIVPVPEPIIVPEPAVAPPEAPKGPASRVGLGMALGGGVTGFVDEEARSFTDPGGSWEARLSVGTRLPVAFELAYIGSAQNIDALGLDNDAVLLGNGTEATVRVNILQNFPVQPYIFGGAGYTHFQLTRTDFNTTSLRDSDNVFNVPFGAGVSFRVARALLLDLRFTGRAAFDDELMEGPFANTDKDAKLHSWNAGARLGWEF